MIKSILKLLGVALVTIVLVSAAFIGGYFVSRVFFPPSPSQVKDGAPPEFRADMGVFWQAWQIVNDEFYKPDKLDPTSLTYGAVSGMVDSLGDPHTAFVDPRAANRLNSDLNGSFEGIGATVEMQSGRLVIVSPIVGSPAERAGIKAGDVVLKVKDAKGETVIQNMTVDDAVNLIRGPKGTTVTLTIQRANTPIFTVDIVRDTIQTPFVSSKMLDNNIGYIRMTEFGATAPQELHSQLSSLLQQKPKAIILDLRNNPGGFLDAAQYVVGEFVKPNSVALIEQFKNGQRTQVPATGTGLDLDVPLVLLVNDGSASASEIVTAALRDYKRATIIGTKTYGKGSVQVPHALSDNSQLRLTIAHFLSPLGLEINEVAVEPDIQVANPTDAEILQGQDPQLDRAIQFITNGASLDRAQFSLPIFEMPAWSLPG